MLVMASKRRRTDEGPQAKHTVVCSACGTRQALVAWRRTCRTASTRGSARGAEQRVVPPLRERHYARATRGKVQAVRV